MKSNSLGNKLVIELEKRKKGRLSNNTSSRERSTLVNTEIDTLLFFSFSTNQLKIVLGRTSRATPEENEQKFQVKSYTVHQRFNSENFNNDIGKKFSDFVTGIPVIVGSSVWLMDWGYFSLFSSVAVEVRCRRLCC